MPPFVDDANRRAYARMLAWMAAAALCMAVVANASPPPKPIGLLVAVGALASLGGVQWHAHFWLNDCGPAWRCRVGRSAEPAWLDPCLGLASILLASALMLLLTVPWIGIHALVVVGCGREAWYQQGKLEQSRRRIASA